MSRTSHLATVILPVLALLWGCHDEPGPTAVELTPLAADPAIGAPAPPTSVSITVGGTSLDVWPYTDTNFEATPSDPVNLVFVGEADPRNVRDALMAVDGSRDGPFAPFTCTWTDAAGGQQTTWSEAEGWTGSVIQLECGAYDPFRFHVRLFSAGAWTLANAHVEVLIPGTTDHQVLSWELAEGLVTSDLAVAGLLTASPARTGPINEAPFFRAIPPVIYNGLPPELRALTGGPLVGEVSEPVGIFTDGSATILSLGDAPAAPGTSQAFTVVFAQTIPKPFCTDGGEFVRVDGAVEFTLDVDVSDDGVLTGETLAAGELVARAVNPVTGEVGDPIPVRVRDHYTARAQDEASAVSSSRHQQLLLPDAPPEELFQQLQVGPHGLNRFRSDERCGT